MIDASLPVVRELSQEVIRLRQLLISSGKAGELTSMTHF